MAGFEICIFELWSLLYFIREIFFDEEILRGGDKKGEKRWKAKGKKSHCNDRC